MPDSESSTSPLAPGRSRLSAARKTVFFALASLVATVLAVTYFADPELFKRVADDLRHFLDARPVLAPVVIAVVYVLCGLLLVPVWWVQLLAGATLGITHGTLVCLGSAVVAAMLTNRFAHRLAGDELIHRLGPTIERLRDRAARSGLRTVAIVRLTHVAPFALANYAFGLLGLRDRDVALGTLIGSAPTIAFYAALGTGNLQREWRTIAVLVALNLLLLAGVWLATRPTGKAEEK